MNCVVHCAALKMCSKYPYLCNAMKMGISTENAHLKNARFCSKSISVIGVKR